MFLEVTFKCKFMAIIWTLKGFAFMFIIWRIGLLALNGEFRVRGFSPEVTLSSMGLKPETYV